MKQQEMILNDFSQLEIVKKSKSYVKVNINDYIARNGIHKAYNVLSLSRDKQGNVTMTAHEAPEDSNEFGYTHLLNRYDIAKIKSLKYLGYFLNFDNANKKCYLWLDNGKNIILKKGFVHSKTSGRLVSNLIAKLGSEEINITEMIEKAILAEHYGLLKEANYLSH